jgi:hypothetical protein
VVDDMTHSHLAGRDTESLVPFRADQGAGCETPRIYPKACGASSLFHVFVRSCGNQSLGSAPR